MPGKKKKTINHFPQIFGVSYAPRDEKCFGNRLHGLWKHNCAPILTKRMEWWGSGLWNQGKMAWIQEWGACWPPVVPLWASAQLPVKWESWMRWSWKFLQDHILHSYMKARRNWGSRGPFTESAHKDKPSMSWWGDRLSSRQDVRLKKTLYLGRKTSAPQRRLRWKLSRLGMMALTANSAPVLSARCPLVNFFHCT